ncbi:hypothetical protein DI09_112p40 [Mitosporidium daphniae]|uniref:RanBD1 domain-containing protein n=1 Tax=Mitosporidium daphniae TaxID=1485682 RepID=A0A098VVX0_9MICR|nr:uncharacterized protein DI09_112p40 [Mitosporidium daphniae]KGG53070.1 hypothetical protein DI09_112p40 [Mitosporidium daphniae]|eukprot:XP_013239506.1 uncharacterized protein DI09_112p40 [Mitosporidium daphniae]
MDGPLLLSSDPSSVEYSDPPVSKRHKQSEPKTSTAFIEDESNEDDDTAGPSSSESVPSDLSSSPSDSDVSNPDVSSDQLEDSVNTKPLEAGCLDLPNKDNQNLECAAQIPKSSRIEKFQPPKQYAKEADPRDCKSKIFGGASLVTFGTLAASGACASSSPFSFLEDSQQPPSFLDSISNDTEDDTVTKIREFCTGEEDEETIFTARGKLFWMPVGSKNEAWRERGVGTVRLNSYPDKKKDRGYRLSMNVTV